MVSLSNKVVRLHIAGLAFAIGAVSAATPLVADPNSRTLVLRERVTASLLGGDFEFKLLKIRGYTVDVRVDGERRKLKIGDQFSAGNAGCSVVFEEILPETRIAHFLTDCP